MRMRDRWILVFVGAALCSALALMGCELSAEKQAGSGAIDTGNPFGAKTTVDKPALSVDTPEPADPATLEALWGNGNDFGVQNGGTPPTFTTDRTRRVRQITTYHFNLHKGTPKGGSYTIKRDDGSIVGTYEANRTVDGQGGVPNAYWYADVDFELPAGTYTLVDSDPATWAQNAQSKGIGFGAVLAVK
jgi:hypothetical protein